MADLKIVSGQDNDATIEGIISQAYPFGKQEIQKAARGKKPVLKIKGLQQIDVCNKYGILFCAYDQQLKVYYGQNLKDELTLDFPEEIKCLKINIFDEQLIAIGLGSELRIYNLSHLISKQINKYESFKIESSFNQITWNNTQKNELIVRDSQSKLTYFINYETKEISNMEETDAVCFDRNNNIVSVLGNEYSVFEQLDVEGAIKTNLTDFIPYELSRVFHIEEYEKNQWIIIGFNRNEVEDKDDENDIAGQNLEYFTCVGDITNNLTCQNPEQIEKASKFLVGNMADYTKYVDFLEFKIITIAPQTYCVFQSISENTSVIQSHKDGMYFTDVEEKIKKFKGQIKGALFANFQIGNKEGYVEVKKPDGTYYQSIPPCVIILDTEMNLSKHFICQNLKKDEANKNLPQNITFQPQILEIQEQQIENQVNDNQDKMEMEIEEIPKVVENINQKQEEIKNQNEEIDNKIQPVLQVGDAQVNKEQIVEKINVENNEQKNEVVVEINKNQFIIEEFIPAPIQYNKDSLKQNLVNLQEYQKVSQKLAYTEDRNIYKNQLDKSLGQKYKFVDSYDPKLEMNSLLSQYSIHSLEYHFESDKIIFCTNEPDGLSYIYALKLDEYMNFIQQMIALNADLKKVADQPIKNMAEKKKLVDSKKKELQEQIMQELKKFRILSSNKQILQIHQIYSFFLAIVHKDSVIIKNLNDLLIENNKIPHILEEINNSFTFQIKQLIFSRSAKYFIIITTDMEVCVLKTINQEILFRKQNILFANFGYEDETNIYILEQNQCSKYNFINKNEQKYDKPYGNQETCIVIHFEEYTKDNFISIQSTNIVEEECNDCNSNGCKKCRENEISVYKSNNLYEVEQLKIGNYNHQWDFIKYIEKNYSAKCFYNSQLKQLVTIFNQLGTVHVLNISENNVATDPAKEVLNWKCLVPQITGAIYLPIKIQQDKDDGTFQFIDGQKNFKITYQLPSLLVLNGVFNVTRLFQFDEGQSKIYDGEDINLQQLFYKLRNNATLKEYKQIIQSKDIINQFKDHPDFYITYQKIQEINHTLQFLEENNLTDLKDAQFQYQKQIVNENNKVIQPILENNLPNIQPNQEQIQNQDMIIEEDNSNKKILENNINNQQEEEKQSQEQQQLQQLLQEQQKLQSYKLDTIKKITEKFNIQYAEQIAKFTESLKLLNYEEDYIPKKIDISQSYQVDLTEYSKFIDSLNQSVQKQADVVEEQNKFKGRMTHQITKIPIEFENNKYQQEGQMFNQMLKIGINKSIFYQDKQLTIFAIKESLFISSKGKLAKLNTSSNPSLTQFTNISFIAKLPQLNDNRINLIVSYEKQPGMFSKNITKNAIYHVIVDEVGLKLTTLRKLHEYQEKNIINIQVLEDTNEILVHYNDQSLQLLYAKKQQDHPAEIMSTWQQVQCATFTKIGSVLIAFSDRITEYIAVQLEKYLSIFERRSYKNQQIGFTEKTLKIKYLYQYNSAIFLAVCQTSNSLVAYPVCFETLKAIQNTKNVDYSISLDHVDKVNHSAIQVQASYCASTKQLYLAHSESNLIYVLPLNLNKMVHLPVQYTCEINGIQASSVESTTFQVFDLNIGLGQVVQFKKNNHSYLQIFD